MQRQSKSGLPFLPTCNEINFKIDKNTCDFAEFYLKGYSPDRKSPMLMGTLNQIVYVFKTHLSRAPLW